MTNGFWNPTLAVIRREYLQRVRSRWFIVVTLGQPLLFLGIVAAAVFLAMRSGDSTTVTPRTMAISDGTGVLYDGLAAELGAVGYRVVEEPWRAGVAAEFGPSREEQDSLIVLDPRAAETGEAALFAREQPNQLRRLVIQGALSAALTRHRLEQQGLDPTAVMPRPELRIELVADESDDQSDVPYIVGLFAAVTMFLVIMIYGATIMTATLEEKTNGVVEVVVASLEPWQLMLGKILGVGAIGITQLATWILLTAIIAVVALVIVGGAEPAPMISPALGELQSMLGPLPGVRLFGLAVLFLTLFLFGFLIYGSLYAAVGALCSTQQDAQQAQLPVTLLILVPVILLRSMGEDPGAPLFTALSFVPFFTPVLIVPRIVAGLVPAWQYVLAFVLMALTLVAVAWVAGKIYKTGILMTGKRPSLPEVWRWVREG